MLRVRVRRRQNVVRTSVTTFLFPTHFDVLCDTLLNRCTKTWKLFANSVVTEVLSV